MRLMTLSVMFAALLSGVSQAAGEYVDVHMHLHPRGLDAAMGNRAERSSMIQPGRGVNSRQGGVFQGPRQGMQRPGLARRGMAPGLGPVDS